jgi:hypothetical protein
VQLLKSIARIIKNKKPIKGNKMKIRDVWHYARPELVSLLINGISTNLIDRATIFAPRKFGKTQFLLKDLKPAAQEAGMLVVYVDFWTDQENPSGVFIEAVKNAILDDSNLVDKVKTKLGFTFNLGLDGVKVGVASKEEKGPLTLTEAFRALEACNTSVLLLLDEVQHLASRPSDKAFVNFTASLRSFMNNRGDNIIKGVFTGSSQDGLSRLFSLSDAPFYNSSQTLPFKVLGDDFVVHCLSIFNDVTGGRTLLLEDAKGVFAKLNKAPGNFIGLLRQMATSQIYDVAYGARMLLPEIMDSEVRAFQSIIVALSDIELNILRYLVEINCKNIYSQSNLNVLRKIDTSVTKNRIQVTVEKLCQLNVLYKVKRGVWEFSEPAFMKYVKTSY